MPKITGSSLKMLSIAITLSRYFLMSVAASGKSPEPPEPGITRDMAAEERHITNQIDASVPGSSLFRGREAREAREGSLPVRILISLNAAPRRIADKLGTRAPYDGGWTVPWQPMEGLQRPASGGGDGTKWRDLTEVTDATKAATLLSLMRHNMPSPGDTEPVCVYDLRGVTPLLTFARAGAGEGVILRDIQGRPRARWNAAFCDGAATGSCASQQPCLAAAHPDGLRPQCFLKSETFRAYPLLRLQGDFFNCEPGMPAEHGHVPPSPGAATPAGIFSPDAGSLRSSAASSPASSRFSSRSGSLAGMEPFPQGFPGGADDIERMRRMLKQTGIGSPNPSYKR